LASLCQVGRKGGKESSLGLVVTGREKKRREEERTSLGLVMPGKGRRRRRTSLGLVVTERKRRRREERTSLGLVMTGQGKKGGGDLSWPRYDGKEEEEDLLASL